MKTTRLLKTGLNRVVSETANLTWTCSPSAEDSCHQRGHAGWARDLLTLRTRPRPLHPRPGSPALGPRPPRAPPGCYWLPSSDFLFIGVSQGGERGGDRHISEFIGSCTRQSLGAGFLKSSLASGLSRRGSAVAGTWLTAAAGG